MMLPIVNKTLFAAGGAPATPAAAADATPPADAAPAAGPATTTPAEQTPAATPPLSVEQGLSFR